LLDDIYEELIMPGLVHLPADTEANVILEILHRDGGVIIDNLISQDEIAQLQSEISPLLEKTDTGKNFFHGTQTRRVGALMARSPACRKLALNPLLNEACKKYLEPYCSGYQLHFSQVVSIGKDEGRQPLHRDRFVWGGYVPAHIETQFSTIWAVTDFTKENGATQVVPGSHRWEETRRVKVEEITWAEMKAGSVFIYSGSTVHGGGANTTEHNRIGALLHYTLNWLRQEENQYLSCPPEIAKNLPKELRSLIGYASGGPVLGFCSPPTGPKEGMELISPDLLFE